MKLTPKQEAIANKLAHELTVAHPGTTDDNYNATFLDFERLISEAIARAVEAEQGKYQALRTVHEVFCQSMFGKPSSKKAGR